MSKVVKYTTAPKMNPFRNAEPWDADVMAKCIGEMAPVFDSLEEAIDDSQLAGVGKDALSFHRITFETLDEAGDVK